MKATIAIIGFMALLLLCSCALPTVAVPRTVRYEVCYSYENRVEPDAPPTWWTPANADLTYENAQGETSQESSARLPWSLEFTSRSGAFVYMSAQNKNSSGMIRVEIYVDGKLFKTSMSKGGHVIASASGTVPVPVN